MTGADWILAHGDTRQFVMYFSLLVALAGLERWLPRRPGPLDRAVRWPANFLLTALNVLALSVLPVSLLAAAFWAESAGWGLLNQVPLPVGISVAITLLVRGFISFSSHYLMHRIPFLRRIHRVHHLDTELDVSTPVRFHPLEFVAQALPGLPIVVAFGLTPWVLVGYELLDVVVTLWSHSNIRVPAAVDRVLHYYADVTVPSRMRALLQRLVGRSAGVFTRRDLDERFRELGLHAVRASASWGHYEAVFRRTEEATS